MRKLFITLIIIPIVSMGIISQQNNNVDFLKKLDLTDQQIEEIKDIQSDMDRKIEEARIELKIQKAMLEKLLFADKVDMDKVEKILKDSLEWQMQIELSEITKRIKTKEIMGAEKWEKFMSFLRKRRDFEKDRHPMKPDK